MGSSLARGPRRGAAMLAAGALVALAMSGSNGVVAQDVQAGRYCAPASPNFGIFSDELQAEQQDMMPAAVGCHGVANAAPNGNGASNSAGSQPEHTYIYGQMAPSLPGQAQTDEESVWMEVYQAQAHDRAE